jgi:hypothetical protein
VVVEGKLPATFAEAFEQLTLPEPNSGCLIWLGATNGIYGSFKRRSVHRLSFEMHRGKIPSGQCVCHTCDNPSCVNPDHFFLGDKDANNRDCRQKGRHRYKVNFFHGEANGNTDLTELKVMAIFADTGSYENVASAYNISQATVSRIKQGQLWKTVTKGQVDQRRRGKRPAGAFDVFSEFRTFLGGAQLSVSSDERNAGEVHYG